MPHNQIVLACDKTQQFYVVYKCVNQVSSYNEYHLNNVPPAANINSIHMRSNMSSFVENMSRRIQPLHDTSSHLSFPTTASNNITTMGRDNDLAYFTYGQRTFSALALGRLHYISAGFSVNNRNYTTLLHGIENRWEILPVLEHLDSLHFSRNRAFPPLKAASSYEKKDSDVICQHQLYENSFSLNTQRQTDTSLVTTSEDLLSNILQYAAVDISLNNMCTDWEQRLRHNLSLPEKVHILIHHEVMRYKHRSDPKAFQEACESISLIQYDDSFKRNLYGIGRSKRNNPEMIHLFPHIPISLRAVLLYRWVRENKITCLSYISNIFPQWKVDTVEKDVRVPSRIEKWNNKHIIDVVNHVISKL